ncbi:MAG: hypothetical protein GY842_14145 [bacterium]|nr:hypothetical protein [bacterium]
MSVGRRWRNPNVRRTAWVVLAVIVVAGLGLVARRLSAAPVIIADNAVILLAADRLCAGFGLTAPVPRIPSETWEWHRDWAGLTQWPAGYPLMLCGLRMLLGIGIVQAAELLNVACCGVGMIAWFVLLRRCLPRRWPAGLIALLGAMGTFTVPNLAQPSSDTVLVAWVALVLLTAWWGLGWPVTPAAPPSRTPSPVRLATLGLFAGAAVWVRYAAVFLPLGMGAFLLLEWAWKRRLRWNHVVVYGVAAATPLLLLAAINRGLSGDLPVAQQYPVGDGWNVSADVQTLTTAWAHFTEQTFYAHRPEAKWFFGAVLPLGAMILPLGFRRSRLDLREFLDGAPVRLGVVIAGAGLLLLVGMTFLFRERFDYAGLDRYYRPIRPFYFLFFVGPILAFRRRHVRVLACVPLLLACSWTVNQDWGRAYRRLASRPVEVTPIGRQALYFEPHSTALYEWLRTKKDDGLLVVSNFPDEIALETWIPACPTPSDKSQLRAWGERIMRRRGVADLRVLFVLDPDNHHRRYFLPPPEDLVAQFDLVPAGGVPPKIAQYVYTPRTGARVACSRVATEGATP